MNRTDFIRPNVFILIGLIFALIAAVTFVLAIPFPEYGLGSACVFSILLGGLFLLIGGNDQID